MPAVPKVFGCFKTAYVLIKPPKLLPATAVCDLPFFVLYFLSINGFNVVAKKST